MSAEPSVEVFQQVSLGEGGVGAAYDDGSSDLSPAVVGDADDGRLGHGRVLEEAVLDLDGRDVLAAADDHVLLAVDDGQVPLGVQRPAVAGVEPPTLERLRARGPLPVARGRDGGARRARTGARMAHRPRGTARLR